MGGRDRIQSNFPFFQPCGDHVHTKINTKLGLTSVFTWSLSPRQTRLNGLQDVSSSFESHSLSPTQRDKLTWPRNATSFIGPDQTEWERKRIRKREMMKGRESLVKENWPAIFEIRLSIRASLLDVYWIALDKSFRPAWYSECDCLQVRKRRKIYCDTCC